MSRAVLAIATTFFGCATAPVAVTGELRRSEAAEWSLRDCLTGEVLALDVSSSRDFVATVEAGTGDRSRGQVIAEVEGHISGTDPRVLSVQRVSHVHRGACDDPVPGE
jgi:hypothetical protein